jgi:Pyrimidine dimer DNA glycosylase
MRIWRVPFQELDDQRVLGQHHEIHGIWTLIAMFPERKWGKIDNLHGNWSDPDNAWQLWNIHQMIEIEMQRRGFNHQSPLEEPPFTRGPVAGIRYEGSARNEDRWHLWLRWHGEFHGRARSNSAIAAYDALDVRYTLQGRVCKHNAALERKRDPDRVICLLCKEVIG